MKLEAIVLSEITQKRKTNAVMIPLTCVNLRKSKLIKAEPRLVLGRGWGQVGDMWRCWSKGTHSQLREDYICGSNARHWSKGKGSIQYWCIIHLKAARGREVKMSPL